MVQGSNLQRHELLLSGTCRLSHHPIRIKHEILSEELTPNLLKTSRVSIMIRTSGVSIFATGVLTGQPYDIIKWISNSKNIALLLV